jgi:hypothetical protein
MNVNNNKRYFYMWYKIYRKTQDIKKIRKKLLRKSKKITNVIMKAIKNKSFNILAGKNA